MAKQKKTTSDGEIQIEHRKHQSDDASSRPPLTDLEAYLAEEEPEALAEAGEDVAEPEAPEKAADEPDQAPVPDVPSPPIDPADIPEPLPASAFVREKISPDDDVNAASPEKDNSSESKVVVPGGVTNNPVNAAAFFRSKYHPQSSHSQPSAQNTLPASVYAQVPDQQASSARSANKTRRTLIISSIIVGVIFIAAAVVLYYFVYIPSQFYTP